MATYQVQSNGSAPSGLKEGDQVVTAGGTYTITGTNADGSYKSTLSNAGQTTGNYSGNYSTAGSSSGGTGSGSTVSRPASSGSGSAPSGFRGSATGVNTYTDDQDAIKAQMNANSQAWYTAATQEEKDALHAQNEYLSSLLGGTVSSSYDPVTGTWGGSAAKPEEKYTAPALPSATSQESYINSLYDAQRKAALAALEAAYNQNIINIDAQAEKIPAIYENARNQTAATAEVNKANFNEAAAASGLNTGAGSQVQLSQNNALLSGLTGLNAKEAQAMTDLETERLRVQTAYQDEIAKAIANGELERAQALYNEAVRVDQSIVQTALNQANLDMSAYSMNQDVSNNNYTQLLQKAETLAAYGDFSGYKALGYTSDQISAMETAYAAALAAQTSSGRGSGGGDGGTPTSDDETGGDADGLFAAAKASANPQNYIASNYKKYGFSNSSGLWAQYQQEYMYDMGKVSDIARGMYTDLTKYYSSNEDRLRAIDREYNHGTISDEDYKYLLDKFGML